MAECLQKSSNENKTNYDTDDEDDYESFCDNFAFSQSESCCVCNGYYGPNFGEPLCGTCHAFLLPVMVEKQTEDLSDNDEDSGNDEPPYNLTASASANRNDRAADAVAAENGESSRRSSTPDTPDTPDAIPLHTKDDERKNVFLGVRPDPSAPRNLRHFLNILAEKRDEIIQQNGGAASVVVPRNGEPVNICDLPVEVLLSIFKYLDDLSLSNVGEVCKQWRKIIEVHTPQTMWQKHTKERWPLYHQITKVPNWFNIYSALMSSCFCRTCLIQMTLKIPVQGVNHFRATRLRGDIRTLDMDATEGIEAVPLDNQLSHWQATIIGPVGSPYEGGKFFLHIIIPFSYPMSPPVVRFLTKIVHPNVSRHGDVGIDIIQHNWSLALTISKLLLSVQSLLTDPFTEICMEPELGRMYDNDRPKFEALARRWTWKYAMFEVIPC